MGVALTGLSFKFLVMLISMQEAISSCKCSLNSARNTCPTCKTKVEMSMAITESQKTEVEKENKRHALQRQIMIKS